MKPPLLMLSMPNSGSNWLSKTIAEALDRRFFLEYFNPLINIQRENQLSVAFGGVTVSYYEQIARASDPLVDKVIEETWMSESPRFDFTKEVYSPRKLASFARYFNCFVMLRSLEQSFPPRRVQIWAYYEHIWHAFLEMDMVDGETKGTIDRCHEAFHLMQACIRADASALGIPVIEYQQLFGPTREIADVMQQMFSHEHAWRVALALVDSRRSIPRQWVDPRSELERAKL